ncbi:unnamed protein product, partial [Sphenostylis stenocarpa]
MEQMLASQEDGSSLICYLHSWCCRYQENHKTQGKTIGASFVKLVSSVIPLCGALRKQVFEE